MAGVSLQLNSLESHIIFVVAKREVLASNCDICEFMHIHIYTYLYLSIYLYIYIYIWSIVCMCEIEKWESLTELRLQRHRQAEDSSQGKQQHEAD